MTESTRDVANALTAYERNQEFNSVTRYLHGFRYRSAIEIMGEVRVAKGATINVLEVGCGASKLFSVLNPIYPINYTGIDIDADHIAVGRERYGAESNFRNLAGDALAALDAVGSADIIFAMETLEHVPDHDAVRIVEKIAAKRPQRFICSVPVEVGPAIWLKNVGSWLARYERHKNYTWSDTLWAGLYQLDKVPPHATGHRGFDWRWLAHTIRHNMRIREIRKFPLRFMPAALSTSVFMVCESR